MNSSSAHLIASRILVVDDEPMGRRLVRQHLPATAQVTECADAESALQAARTHAHDVALVDVLLPGLDGFSLCRQLKADPLTADMPVILVTAKSGIEDLERGFEAGATDYVRKPFNPRELAARVRNAVELKQRGDSLRRWTERMTRDLALAGALQRSLLAPRPFLQEDMRIYTAYQPSIEVGGDFFDILPLADGRVAVYVGDVAGHGVGAAIAATLLKASLSELLREHASAGPARICNELHTLFLSQLRAPGLYATLFLALVDTRQRQWTCLNCGHPGPIVIAPPGLKRCDFEARGGPPVGFCLAGANPYSEQDEVSQHLPEDVIVMLVTDGLLEAPNSRDPEASTRKHLVDLINHWRTHRDQPVMDYIVEGMRTAGFALGEDDCTALLVEQIPHHEVVFHTSAPCEPEHLARLAHAMEDALRAQGWPETSRWAAHLVVMEHGANVLKHGHPDPDSHLAVQARLTGDTLEILMRDRGQPWRYEEAVALDAAADADHGRGLQMILRIASSVASHRDGEENVSLFTVSRNWQVPA
jgi:sigma-B regulation protein RsbU (phosphoserine phosphatase)